MRHIDRDFAASRTSLILVDALAAILLITACATPPIVVKTAPSFAPDTIRSVYVMPFASPDGNHEAESLMTQALREQLQADGILRLVDRPGLADASFQGTVEKWVRGGLDLSGTRPRTWRRNSGHSSRKSTPWCASDTSPGSGTCLPPISPTSEMV
jgi:Lipopolysaccharide-assembly